MTPDHARTLWHRLEALNAVAYFAPECAQAPTDLGLRGFWMGYVASRAAPLGPVPPGVVEATFFNFHPDRIRRALPDAWALASPEAVLRARAEAAAAALRRLLGAGAAEQLAADVLPACRAAIAAADGGGRPLFAANRDVTPGDDPVAALWQAATTLREHRGDGHVALLTGAGLDGCGAHVLFVAGTGGAPELHQASRGWSAEDWAEAVGRLADRGLVTPDETLTDAGRGLRDEIEQRTDALALAPYRVLGGRGVEELLARLRPAQEQVTASGEITFPNPMGLPPAGADPT